MSVTSRRYRQTNSSQALKETNRFTQLLRGFTLIRKGVDATTRLRVRLRLEGGGVGSAITALDLDLGLGWRGGESAQL